MKLLSEKKISVANRSLSGRPKRSRSSAAGFTIIELLTVVVIVGILSSVTVPSLRGYLQNQKIGTAARNVVTNLRFARLKAVSEKNPWVVLFQVGRRQYVVFADDGGGGGIATDPLFDEDNRGNLRPDPGERVFGPLPLSGGVMFGMVASDNLPDGITTSVPVSFGGSPPRIVFYPNGSARETGVIMLQLAERVLALDPTGQRAIIIYKPTGAAKSLMYNASGTPRWK